MTPQRCGSPTFSGPYLDFAPWNDVRRINREHKDASGSNDIQLWRGGFWKIQPYLGGITKLLCLFFLISVLFLFLIINLIWQEWKLLPCHNSDVIGEFFVCSSFNFPQSRVASGAFHSLLTIPPLCTLVRFCTWPQVRCGSLPTHTMTLASYHLTNLQFSCLTGCKLLEGSTSLVSSNARCIRNSSINNT